MDAYAAYLKKAGFPEKYGMLECNMLVRNHTCQEMQQLMEQWWNEFLSSETKRDQLSLPFVLWKNHIRVEQITRLGGMMHCVLCSITEELMTHLLDKFIWLLTVVLLSCFLIFHEHAFLRAILVGIVGLLAGCIFIRRNFHPKIT